MSIPTAHNEQNPLKRRKISAPEEINTDKIDPVEKLLSLTNLNNDILNVEDLSDDETSSDSDRNEMHSSSHDHDQHNSSTELKSLNFTKILNDNIRSYYANFRKSPLETYNDHSSFAVLNTSSKQQVHNTEDIMSPPTPNATPTFTHNPNVPFFKNVNFNSRPSGNESSSFDDYFSYDEADKPVASCSSAASSAASTPSASTDSPVTPNDSPSFGFAKLNNKMRFHYRQNHNNLNLSDLSSCSSSALSYESTYPVHTTNPDSHDIFKILNKRSILTGKASEMVSTGTFLINDFFL